ncbi:MAG: hypothetical protein H0W14_08005, partial [Actinobacteria bacterium]|nr:hypothetical protein [Actinomycetota bacterium]
MPMRHAGLERLAEVTDEARAAGDLPKQGDNQHSRSADARRTSAPDHRRVAEGRALAATGALAEAEAEGNQAAGELGRRLDDVR